MDAWARALGGRRARRFALDSGALRDGRRLFNLTATPLGADRAAADRRAAARARALDRWSTRRCGPIEIHNAHIPPAQSNGLTKVETCEALFAAARPVRASAHRILCGDLNTPRLENGVGEVETFASNHPDHEERWDAAERSLLVGLAEWDLTRRLPRAQRLRPPRRQLGHAHPLAPQAPATDSTTSSPRHRLGAVRLRLPARVAGGRAQRSLGDRGDFDLTRGR